MHNTVTVDRKTQQFGGGHRLYFQGDDAAVRAVGAYTDDVYGGVRFERHVALHNGTIVVVDRLFSDAERVYDLAHHSFGALATDLPLEPVEKLDAAPMYELAANPRRGSVPAGGRAAVHWQQDDAVMWYQVVNVEDRPLEMDLATGWANVRYQLVRQEAPFVMARQHGKSAVFVSVMSFGAAPVAVGRVERAGDRLAVELPDGRLEFDFAANKVNMVK